MEDDFMYMNDKGLELSCVCGDKWCQGASGDAVLFQFHFWNQEEMGREDAAGGVHEGVPNSVGGLLQKSDREWSTGCEDEWDVDDDDDAAIKEEEREKAATEREQWEARGRRHRYECSSSSSSESIERSRNNANTTSSSNGQNG